MLQVLVIPFMKRMNGKGPNIDPWGTSNVTGSR